MTPRQPTSTPTPQRQLQPRPVTSLNDVQEGVSEDEAQSSGARTLPSRGNQGPDHRCDILATIEQQQPQPQPQELAAQEDDHSQRQQQESADGGDNGSTVSSRHEAPVRLLRPFHTWIGDDGREYDIFGPLDEPLSDGRNDVIEFKITSNPTGWRISAFLAYWARTSINPEKARRDLCLYAFGRNTGSQLPAITSESDPRAWINHDDDSLNIPPLEIRLGVWYKPDKSYQLFAFSAIVGTDVLVDFAEAMNTEFVYKTPSAYLAPFEDTMNPYGGRSSRWKRVKKTSAGGREVTFVSSLEVQDNGETSYEPLNPIEAGLGTLRTGGDEFDLVVAALEEAYRRAKAGWWDNMGE
ncbi:uncharacterized protein P884DRAFT_323120, partial [Thermothelomyces heterothallicus CBS 202.75]|uniref:uncharacterized protein n=1 Tax=Thermothelomyces heterothallicus CBS 202.75 TaxID=1149848 RepID=UPI0037436BBA